MGRDSKTLCAMNDEALLRELETLVRAGRKVEARIVEHIAEVDRRRLFLSRGYSSMFTYCTQALHLSESVAYKRIQAARVSRKYPPVLRMLDDGQLHITAVARLAKLLTRENHETVLARAAQRTKCELDELIAELAPKPDVRPSIRKLPEPTKAPNSLEKQLDPDPVKNSRKRQCLKRDGLARPLEKPT